jgi:hypothetical protein
MSAPGSRLPAAVQHGAPIAQHGATMKPQAGSSQPDADRVSVRSERVPRSATYGSHSLVRRAPTRAVRLLFTVLALVLLLTPVASRQLTAIRVSEGQDLQAAIEAAKPGDLILLASGARFSGNFVLPKHGDSPAFITIRTDADGLPEPGVRTGPKYSGRLAVLQSPNNVSALRTAPGAHHWRIEHLEFRANAGGYGDIIALGNGGTDQSRLEDVPHHIVLDRVYIHGDPLMGQKRGIALNSASTEIVNSYIADIRAVGQDSQAIAGWNGPGPFSIVNNYVEAAGENVLFGGADPGIQGLIPQGIVVRGNHIARPPEWRDPVVATPSGLAGTPVPSGALEASGSPVASGFSGKGPYSYRIVAERLVASGQQALSLASDPVTVTLGGEDAGVALTWRPVEGATRYRVYRRSPADGEVWWSVKEPTFTDDGTPGRAGAPPKSATVWSVKNLFELKNARDVEVDRNTFEFNWESAQDGYAILIKPVNQDGRALWATIENVRFTNNVVRHVAAAININGTDTYQPSARARGITIRNNLFVDVSRARWGGPGDFLKIGNAPANIVVEDNTVINDGRIINVYGGKGGERSEGFVFRRNVVRHNRYGVKGQSTATGLATLERFFPGGIFEGNVIGGGKRDAYPEKNRIVPDNEYERVFVDAVAGDYRLQRSYAGAGSTLRD